jgi:hypothetical protein
MNLTETTVELTIGEYENHPSPHDNLVNPYWEHIEFDNATCSRGHLCPSYDRRLGSARVIGGYIGSEGIHEKYVWTTPWYFPSAPGLPICEDCADLVDDVDYDDSVFTGTIADAHWFIDRAPAYCDDTGKFYAWVGYFAPDGGLDHEIELGTFDTVGAARTAIAVWGGERNRDLDAYEAEIAAANADDPWDCDVHIV